MELQKTPCEHPNVVKQSYGMRECRVCGVRWAATPRRRPETKPHLVNGYAVTRWEYDRIRERRAERDRAIESAKTQYQTWLTEFLGNSTAKRPGLVKAVADVQ